MDHEHTSNNHGQYLGDIGKVAEDFPDHRPLRLERVLNHLLQWSECVHCCEEAMTKSLPEAERSLVVKSGAFMAEKSLGAPEYVETSSAVELLARALEAKHLFQRRERLVARFAPHLEQVRQKVVAEEDQSELDEEEFGSEPDDSQDPFYDEPSDEKYAEFERHSFNEALAHVLSRLPSKLKRKVRRALRKFKP